MKTIDIGLQRQSDAMVRWSAWRNIHPRAIWQINRIHPIQFDPIRCIRRNPPVLRHSIALNAYSSLVRFLHVSLADLGLTSRPAHTPLVRAKTSLALVSNPLSTLTLTRKRGIWLVAGAYMRVRCCSVPTTPSCMPGPTQTQTPNGRVGARRIRDSCSSGRVGLL